MVRKTYIVQGLKRIGRSDPCRILASNAQGVVAGTVVDHHDLVTWPQGCKRPTQADPVVAGVQDGRDGRHGGWDYGSIIPTARQLVAQTDGHGHSRAREATPGLRIGVVAGWDVHFVSV